MESPKTLVTEDDNACSIVAVEVNNRHSDMTEIPKTANVDFGKAVESLDTDAPWYQYGLVPSEIGRLCASKS